MNIRNYIYVLDVYYLKSGIYLVIIFLFLIENKFNSNNVKILMKIL